MAAEVLAQIPQRIAQYGTEVVVATEHERTGYAQERCQRFGDKTHTTFVGHEVAGDDDHVRLEGTQSAQPSDAVSVMRSQMQIRQVQDAQRLSTAGQDRHLHHPKLIVAGFPEAIGQGRESGNARTAHDTAPRHGRKRRSLAQPCPTVCQHGPMSEDLKARLQADLSTAIKGRDELTAATLRMALAAITTEEVAGKQARVLSDAEVVTVLGREAKKRREAAEAFDAAGRGELADRERAELGVLETYLPAQLDDAELRAIVAAAITESGASGAAAMGAVMKIVSPQVAGRAEGGRVAAEVRAQLG